MTATTAEIRAGLATNINNGISNVQVSAYVLSNPVPPVIMVYGPDPVTYDTTLGGTSDLTISVFAYVGMATDIGAQKTLDVYLASAGTGSVKAAIESDPTLGGKVDSLRVVSDTGYRQYAMLDGTVYLGCEWSIEIFNKA